VLVSRSGERRDVRDSAAPVRTLDGKIIGAVLVFQDVTQSRVLQRQLEHSAMHDGLTGLPNRSSFERALAAAIEQARRELREHALCFVDLDRFKNVNDTAGHAAGDALLKDVARVIRKSCRSQDFCARIGGDEFAVVQAGASGRAGAMLLAERMLAALATPLAIDGRRLPISASIGIGLFPDHGASPEQLHQAADQALYQAKAAGPANFRVWEPTGAAVFPRVATG
jgi:diguanylate cyclase (GGDEF)-like protein